MKKPYDDWDELREQVLGFGQGSARKSYYPALRKRIAELEKIEAELRESWERLELALDGAELGMWDWSIPDGRVLFNNHWAEMLGYLVDDLEPFFGTWEKLLHPEDSQGAHQIIEDHLAQKTENFSMEFRLRHKDGSWVWILSKGRVIDRAEDGTPLRACGTHLNITSRVKTAEQRRQLEHQVQHKQKLESLGILAGGIAHDFNNLLVAILGNSDLALMEIPDSSAAWEYLSEVRTAAQRASELTNQMLAYSGMGRFVVETVSLNSVVQEITRLLEAAIPKKVTIVFKLATELPLVEMDSTQIRQVVMNLVTNAADSMVEKGGIISIATGVFEVDQEYLPASFLDEKLTPGPYVYLEVSDSGCGMNQETKMKLFDPFFTTKAAGRGLGMAAVQGIVRGHKGSIRVDSEESNGSTFRVLLPVSEAILENKVRQTEEPALSSRSATVLVVDDESSVRMLLQRMLEKLGHRVLSACDGIEALEVFAKNSTVIDLVLLDMTMPLMDGMEVYHQLRSMRNNVRVVISSGYSKQETTNRFAGNGVFGFIQKPYTFEELKLSLDEALKTDFV